MADQQGTDPNDEVLRQFGDPSKNKDQARLVNLSEAQNKGPEEPAPFKITVSK